MSVSTCSYCNSSAYYSGMATKSTTRFVKSQHVVRCDADVKQSNAVAKDAWSSELSGRIHTYGDTANRFIDILLPCSMPYTPDGNIQNVFDAYAPGPGRERLEYNNLVRTSHTPLRFPL